MKARESEVSHRRASRPILGGWRAIALAISWRDCWYSVRLRSYLVRCLLYGVISAEGEQGLFLSNRLVPRHRRCPVWTVLCSQGVEHQYSVQGRPARDCYRDQHRESFGASIQGKEDTRSGDQEIQNGTVEARAMKHRDAVPEQMQPTISHCNSTFHLCSNMSRTRPSTSLPVEGRGILHRVASQATPFHPVTHSVHTSSPSKQPTKPTQLKNNRFCVSHVHVCVATVTYRTWPQPASPV